MNIADEYWNALSVRGEALLMDRQKLNDFVQMVGEQIAKEIEAIIPDLHSEHEPCLVCWAIRAAAAIARGKK